MPDDQHQRAQAYNAAVLGVGYVGAFSLLSYTAHELTHLEKAVSAAGLLFSIAVFMTWVVFEMAADRLALERKQARQPPSNVLWRLAMALTILPALVAAITMFQAYMRVIFREGNGP